MFEDTYNDYFLTKIQELFPKKEREAFFKANEEQRPTTLRVNTLLISRKDLMKLLLKRKVEAEELNWCEEGIVVYKSNVPLGATPEYLAGYYIIQGANSFLPVLNMELMPQSNKISLLDDDNKNLNKDLKKDSNKDLKKDLKKDSNKDLKKDLNKNLEGDDDKSISSSVKKIKHRNVTNPEVVIDLCSAPGAKSTHIGQLMNNKGILYLNDLNKDRLFAVVSNCHRMFIKNSIITNFNALDFNCSKKADRILLDTPCSGTGVIAKDPTVKMAKSEKEIIELSKVQKKLICHAFENLLKEDGILIYSTCSILVEENEEIVDYLLKKYKNAKVMDLDDCLTGCSIGKEGFSSFRGKSFNATLTRSRRIYPHVHNMDGFYYCKIKKI